MWHEVATWGKRVRIEGRSPKVEVRSANAPRKRQPPSEMTKVDQEQRSSKGGLALFGTFWHRLRASAGEWLRGHEEPAAFEAARAESLEDAPGVAFDLQRNRGEVAGWFGIICQLCRWKRPHTQQPGYWLLPSTPKYMAAAESVSERDRLRSTHSCWGLPGSGVALKVAVAAGPSHSVRGSARFVESRNCQR